MVSVIVVVVIDHAAANHSCHWHMGAIVPITLTDLIGTMQFFTVCILFFFKCQHFISYSGCHYIVTLLLFNIAQIILPVPPTTTMVYCRIAK